MEMHQVRYVLAAAEQLNFTRAAAQCDVSQPALTKGIKALETEMNAPLFHRDGRRIIVSQFGQMMLPHLRQIAAEAEAARSLAQKYQQLHETPLRLGVQSTIGPRRFGALLKVFNAAHAGVDLAVSSAPLAALITAMSSDELDAALVTRLESCAQQLDLLPLYSERYVAVVAQDHPLAGAPQVGLSDLSTHSYIDRSTCEMREALMAACAERGVELRARIQAERDDWVQDMVASGLGFALLPQDSVTHTGLVTLPLTDPVIAREVCLGKYPGRSLPPGATALTELAQSFPWDG